MPFLVMSLVSFSQSNVSPTCRLNHGNLFLTVLRDHLVILLDPRIGLSEPIQQTAERLVIRENRQIAL